MGKQERTPTFHHGKGEVTNQAARLVEAVLYSGPV
jgi:hypothetical protein